MIKKTALSAIILIGVIHAYNPYLYLQNNLRWGRSDMRISHFHLKTIADGMVARNILTIVFHDIFDKFDHDSLEMHMRFQLPPNAVVDSMYLWINNEPISAFLKTLSNANRIYSEIVRRRWDPALLTKNSWNNDYYLRVFPFYHGKKRKVRICYTQPFDIRYSQKTLSLPTSMLASSQGAASAVNIEIQRTSEQNQKVVFFGEHKDLWEIKENGKMVFQRNDRSLIKNIGFHLQSTFDQGILLACSKSQFGATNFISWVHPQTLLELAPRAPKNLVILYNNTRHESRYIRRNEYNNIVSYRSQGTIYQQALANFLLNFLRPKDNIEIFLNYDKVYSLKSDILPKSANRNEKIAKLLSLNPEKPSNNALAPLLFLYQIFSKDFPQNTEFIFIDMLGGGYVRNGKFLGEDKDFTSKLPKGSRFHVISQFSNNAVTKTYQKLADHSKGRIETPRGYFNGLNPLNKSLLNIKSAMTGRLYPANLSFQAKGKGFLYGIMGPGEESIPVDEPVMYMGRIYGSDTISITLSGRLDGEGYSVKRNIPVRYTVNQSIDAGKLWAAQKVQGLIGGNAWDISQWQEATNLSLYYRILTPYTALLALEEGVTNAENYQDDKLANNPDASQLPIIPQNAAPSQAIKLSAQYLADGIHIGFGSDIAIHFDTQASLIIYNAKGRVIANLSQYLKLGKGFIWKPQNLKKGRYILLLKFNGKVYTTILIIR